MFVIKLKLFYIIDIKVKMEVSIMRKKLLLLSLLTGLVFSFSMKTVRVEAIASENSPEVQVRSIIGSDERVRIFDTTESPYNSIAFIAADGAAGSGAVIGKNTVLTAAHVVKNIRNNPNKESIYVIPGRNGTNLPYGKFKIESVHIPQRYIENPSVDSDIAVITVGTLNGKSIGELVPILPYKLTNTVETGMDLITTGYPGDKTWGTMWSSNGTVQGQTNTRIYYNMDTAGGQSGSPVYNLNKEIVGVHTTGAGSKNFATKLNNEYYQFVSKNIS